ncbi:tyrosine-type recombinase/integrase [Nocardia sp. NPDC049220]|uniref:tyrosine-type recombinase/integrase n=1 Tax=Nocardia sp. NPDC049220 TaxID=3155273 RepID=UPI0033D193A7
MALPDWATFQRLAAALVDASADRYQGWGDLVVFAACTATRIGEVSGCRVGDVDTEQWVWMLRRQTTPGPGGLKDKGTKGKRAREIPIIEEFRPLVLRRVNLARARVDSDPTLENSPVDARNEAYLDARLFVGPRGGRIATGVLRRATHWDDVVAQLGYEHLRRHDLRHTGLTWFADAGVPAAPVAADRRPHRSADHPAVPPPGHKELRDDGGKLSQHLRGDTGPQLAPTPRAVQ